MVCNGSEWCICAVCAERVTPARGMVNMKGIERRPIPTVFSTADYFPTGDTKASA
eukprot:m.98317 g.98317  ORF g.98317 m.98317 type:complete len:55 (+) comp16741_c0_seq2:136-300(+)